MTIRARIEYELDENGDPIRLNQDEANSSCAAAEVRPVTNQLVDALRGEAFITEQAAPAAKAKLVNYHGKGKGRVNGPSNRSSNPAT